MKAKGTEAISWRNFLDREKNRDYGKYPTHKYMASQKRTPKTRPESFLRKLSEDILQQKQKITEQNVSPPPPKKRGRSIILNTIINLF